MGNRAEAAKRNCLTADKFFKELENICLKFIYIEI